MDKQAQETLLALFRELLAGLREGENFDVYRVTDSWVIFRLSVGTGSAKWSVEHSVTLTGLVNLRSEVVPAIVADMFDRLRRPGSAS